MSTSTLTDQRICAIVSRTDVEKSNLGSVMQLLASLNIQDPAQADLGTLRQLRSKISIIVAGYDDDPRELYEIPEVRSYFQTLQRNWPYGLYFFDREVKTAHLLVLCHAGFSILPHQDSRMRNLQIDQNSVGEFLSAALYPTGDITERLGWTSAETVELAKEIVIALGLKEPHSDGTAEKRERHTGYLTSKFESLAAFAWSGYMDEGPGFLLIFPGGSDNPTGSRVMYCSVDKLTQLPPGFVGPDLQRMLREYNPRQEIVVAIEEPDGLSLYRFAKPAIYPPDAWERSRNRVQPIVN